MPERGQGAPGSSALARRRVGARDPEGGVGPGRAALSSPIPGMGVGFALEMNPWRTMTCSHLHDCLEISYVLQGDGLFMVGDIAAGMCPGALFVIPPGVSHCAVDPPEGRHWNLSLYLRPESVAWLGTQAEGVVRHVALVSGRRWVGPLSRVWEHLFGQLGELFDDRIHPDHAMIATKLVEACLLAERCPADDGTASRSETGAAHPVGVPAGRDTPSRHFARMLAIIESDPRTCAREVAERVGLHPHYASQLFARAVGQSLTQYIRKRHLERALQLVATSHLPIAEIAQTCGFRDLSTFYRSFVKEFRRTPGAIRRQGASRPAGTPAGRLSASSD